MARAMVMAMSMAKFALWSRRCKQPSWKAYYRFMDFLLLELHTIPFINLPQMRWRFVAFCSWQLEFSTFIICK